MAIYFQRLRILRGQNLQRGVPFQRPSEVLEISVDARDNSVICQPRTDGFGDIQRVGPCGNLLRAAVRQSDRKATHFYGDGSFSVSWSVYPRTMADTTQPEVFNELPLIEGAEAGDQAPSLNL